MSLRLKESKVSSLTLGVSHASHSTLQSSCSRGRDLDASDHGHRSSWDNPNIHICRSRAHSLRNTRSTVDDILTTGTGTRYRYQLLASIIFSVATDSRTPPLMDYRHSSHSCSRDIEECILYHSWGIRSIVLDTCSAYNCKGWRQAHALSGFLG